MENTQTIESLCEGKAVALWGRGVSTASAERLLKRLGISSIYYGEGEKSFDESAAANHKLAIYSPSFKPNNALFETAKKCGVETMGEPDLAGLLWRGEIIVITGTNGKTTLTSFIAHALNKAGRQALALGNIGEPMCEYADNSENKIAVCELSSFQGMRLKHLHANALVWTNFAADHLDWHADIQEYFEAKLQIAKLLKSEIFIVGESVKNAAHEFEIALPSFTKIVSENNFIDAPAPFDNSIQSKNFATALVLWHKLGLDENILYDAAKDFKLSAHRFSKTAEINGVSFWNDSKATNVHAAIAALKELKGTPLIWIGGGKNKHCDLSELTACVKECAQGAALIGETSEFLKDGLAELPLGAKTFENLSDALKWAFEKAEKDANILFSPAFSSFGMFENYADRGKSFEKLVLCLK